MPLVSLPSPFPTPLYLYIAIFLTEGERIWQMDPGPEKGRLRVGPQTQTGPGFVVYLGSWVMLRPNSGAEPRSANHAVCVSHVGLSRSFQIPLQKPKKFLKNSKNKPINCFSGGTKKEMDAWMKAINVLGGAERTKGVRRC